MLHEGERTVQRRAGVTVPGWGSAGVDALIPPVAAEFLGRQQLVVITAATDDGAAWVSVLSGPPGFATAPDDRTVVAERLPDPGDPLAGRFDTEHDIGMLMIEPATRKRMRVNGRARRDGHRLLVRTQQVYSNCPKYIQTRTPTTDELPPGRVVSAGEELNAGHRRWVAAADTFFIGTYAPGHGADASHRGGNPGFITTGPDNRLTWPDYIGNSMYMTLGNLHIEPRCGLLFVDWQSGHTLHLTGRATADWDPARVSAVPGAHRLIDFDVEQFVERAGGIPQRWAFGRYSRFNPT